MTAPEYNACLEELMSACGHSYRTIAAYAFVHGDDLPRSTFHRALRTAALPKQLLPRDVVAAFVRACYCRAEGLPLELNPKRLPRPGLCQCEPRKLRPGWPATTPPPRSTNRC
ncbi:hypothetical protein AVL48_36510 [Amycolatopsis regifaucium]|uniref:Uncharacterized protein n=1 Tax=Amycolatopsis regifaucium TaxID=546365 RepID=A0A154MFY9_9PSEU|nr:hypothetical protein AVL48_36510 [Amycolatopsis regifaucium]